MSDKMREEFEAWARSHNESLFEDEFDVPEDIRLDKQGGAYIWANAESAWLAWQASRAALVVELPQQGREYDRADQFYNMAIDSCREAIHATGVTTK